MIIKFGKIFFPLILLFALVPAVLAHTPLKPGEENNSLETAFEIPEPTKSWTLYRELHEAGEAEYYKLQLEAGERLLILLYTPTAEDPNFNPNLAVMGPGLTSTDKPPEFVEVPQGIGTAVIEAHRPERPEYEPFTPASYYYLAEFDLEIETGGTYYFAVYDPTMGGRYGIGVGYLEKFSLLEWIRVPWDVVGIRRWEGQPLILIFTPMLATFVIGAGLLIWKFELDRNASRLVGAAAGLLYLGSGFMTLMQMITSLIGAKYDSSSVLTIIFVLLPILLGTAILRKITSRRPFAVRDRFVILALGLIGFFSWAGILMGPALAMFASVIPSGVS